MARLDWEKAKRRALPDKPPSRAQLNYLKVLRERSHTSLPPPKTMSEASLQINMLRRS